MPNRKADMFVFSIIFRHLDGTGSWKPASWKTWTDVSYTVYKAPGDTKNQSHGIDQIIFQE